MMMEDAGDGFTFRKPMPDRRNFKPWGILLQALFRERKPGLLFKNFSYDCNGPYY